MLKTKPLKYKYHWEGTNCPSGKDDWKKTEKNNLTIALNVLFVKIEKIYPADFSKQNSMGEKQVITLMIPKWDRWNYLAAKRYQYY